jgi:CarD family transcriptional regulator
MAKTAPKTADKKRARARPQPRRSRRGAAAPAKPPKPAAKPVAKATHVKTSAAKAAPPKMPPAKAPPVRVPAPKAPVAKAPVAKAPLLKAPVPKAKVPPAPVDIGFETGDFVVYPTHGVGRISGIETQEIAGYALMLLIIQFDKEKMTLRVPTGKARQAGLRKLSSRKVMDSALKTLRGRSRVKRTMWSRRAQEYEAKINSGDPVSIAEVVRDLHRSSDQPDQSYSERQIYQAALDRLARELAAVEEIDDKEATQRLEELLKAA